MTLQESAKKQAFQWEGTRVEARGPEPLPWEPLESCRHLTGDGGARQQEDASGNNSRRGDVASVLFGQASPAEDDVRGPSRRELIYEYVMAHPGSHVRGVTSELGLATGDAQYHLYWLERHSLIETRRGGFYRFVFPVGLFNERQEVILGTLSQETPREILMLLMQRGTMTQRALAQELGHSQPTISWHMQRLTQLGIVSKRRTNREVLYEIVADRGDILNFVKRYHPSVWDRWAERLGEPAVVGRDGRKDSGEQVVQELRLVARAAAPLRRSAR